MAGKQGLVPVQRQVMRNGRSFITTVYINPNQVSKIKNQTQHVQVPTWSFKSTQDLDDEVKRINKLKDPSEKKVLKEALLTHLEKDMGASWNKSTHEGINWMRALMSAKSLINTKPGQATPVVPANKPAASTSTKGAPMSTDDAKAAIKELTKKHGSDQMVDKIKQAGLSWNEHSHKGINKMRAFMALRSHLESGGTFDGVGGKPSSNSQPQVTVPAGKKKKDDKPTVTVPKSKYKAGSFEKAYEDAAPMHKAIAIHTGIMPESPEAMSYLLKLVEEGKFEITQSGEDYGLSKRVVERINTIAKERAGTVNPISDAGIFDIAWKSRGSQAVKAMFANAGEEDKFNTLKKDMRTFVKKHSSDALREGVTGMQSIKDTVEFIQKDLHTISVSKVSKYDIMSRMSDHLRDNAKGKIKANKLWVKLGMDNLLDPNASVSESASVLGKFIDMTGASSDIVRAASAALGSTGLSPITNIQQKYEQGTVTKQEILNAFSVAIEIECNAMSTRRRKDNFLAEVIDWSAFGEAARLLKESSTKKPGIPVEYELDINKLNDSVDEIIKDLKPMTTKDARYVAKNMAIYQHVYNAVSGYGTIPDHSNLEPVSEKEMSSVSFKEILMRQAALSNVSGTAKTKLKEAMKAKDNKNADKFNKTLHESFRDKDYKKLDKLEYPTPEKAKEKIKTTLGAVPAAEQQKIKDRVAATHDKRNHASFDIKVNNVFRIKHMHYEDEFQKIDDARNHTDYYYHGTDYWASQKIFGESGQFVVTKTNVKAGRMLGDGVYLAENSSKSAQYSSRDFSRGQASGVLLLCKASLGKVEESTIRDSGVNTRLLDKNGVDTVFMDKPHVLNREWAVKEEKAVLPKLWIDITRISK
ncbi:hypothetical protein [Bacillus paranthracis]|uniref:hypothetical protein n=1 Tax=Bacillus paranthracis TaxID=2026186 RepID=UPI0022E0ABD7|nr:hypothetical protein [Bacillus paranthracis]